MKAGVRVRVSHFVTGGFFAGAMTLLRQYLAGSLTDSPTWMKLAKCITASGRTSRNNASTKPASPMQPTDSGAPSVASRRPLERSSANIAWKPAQRSCLTMCEPI